MNQIASPAFPEVPPNDPPNFPIPDTLLPELFTAAAKRYADRIALIGDGHSLGYADLNDRADRLAAGLRARGIGRGAYVGLWMARGLDVHIGLLAILKAGAAYVPFDGDAPAERVADCLADAGAVALLVDSTTRAKAGELSIPVWSAEALVAENPAAIEAMPRIDLRADGVSSADPAYLIYTSGSTGTPKGVVISHRNICHFLAAAQTVYELRADDVVFQGGSVAFDLSLEEIFVPYLAGATLWVARQDVLLETDRLSGVMTAAGITVLDTVPTLLALLTDEVPSLRLIVVGGEALTPALVARWARPGRRIFNTYGPTETTVVATAIEVTPDQAVTIGRPLPGYRCYVADENLALVTAGVEGELLIGGPGVAAGYVNRPELTAAKFIANPYPSDGTDPCLYRTGDAVSWDQESRLVFHGRIDDQVKIRGFRVELGEIEARLEQVPGVTQAAVLLRRIDGADLLVAFLVAPGVTLDPAALRAFLRTHLPAYMIPALFQRVDVVPRLVSGKLDRKTLARLSIDAPASTEDQEEALSDTEATLLAAARTVFHGLAIALTADFFLDLGGHSLVAARFVSLVRKTAVTAELTLHDVYTARSLRAMAAQLDARRADGRGQQAVAFDPPPLIRRFLCGLAQSVALILILTMTTAPWLGVFVAYELLTGDEINFIREVGVLIATYGLFNLAVSMIAIVGKWLAIGRTRPGVYPVWGVYYFRWWLARQFIDMIHFRWFRSTPIMRLALRCLGARIGHDAVIGDINAGAIDLVSIGAQTTIGGRVQFANAQVVGDRLVIGPVTVGADVLVGSSSVLGRDVTVGDGAELADLTALAAGQRVKPGEKWEGSPAKRIGVVDAREFPPHTVLNPTRRAVQVILYALMLVLLPPVALIPIIPAFYLLDSLGDRLSELFPLMPLYYLGLPLIAWPSAMALIAVTVLLIAAIRWAVLPRVTIGTSSIHSWFYFRKWVVSLTTELTLETLSSLYATVYMRNWFRLMGAKIGKDSEISAPFGGLYDLIEIGEKCFIADEVVLGDEHIRRGWMTLKALRTGARVFVGNSAVVPSGSQIPANTLIGVKSRPPADNARMTEGSIWFGSPPIQFPVRQRFDDVEAAWTFDPPWPLRLRRAVYEAFSVSFPSMLAITFGMMSVEVLAPSVQARDFVQIIGLFVGASIVIAISLMLAALAVKWIMMGRYRPTTKPMWSWWALRTESVAVTYGGLAGNVLFQHLRGTPMLPWLLRLFGCKFGQGVFMDGFDFTEFDCIEIGDYVSINANAILQTHLYEDRVMKVGRIKIGKGVSIATGTTVLYDTQVGDYTHLGPLTIVMKGEEIPAYSVWQGAPAQTVG